MLGWCRRNIEILHVLYAFPEPSLSSPRIFHLYVDVGPHDGTRIIEGQRPDRHEFVQDLQP